MVKELEPSTDSLKVFWADIFVKIDGLRNSTPIPTHIRQWKKRNLDIYNKFLAEYLAPHSN